MVVPEMSASGPDRMQMSDFAEGAPQPAVIHASATRELLVAQLRNKADEADSKFDRDKLLARAWLFENCCNTNGLGMKPGNCVWCKTKCVKWTSNALAACSCCFSKIFGCCISSGEQRMNQIVPS